eukprot:TRINITY_DN3286_c0_g1_i1.p1 TRINITY_DN3286_c0_g1~~TRINITY_DN3286_c0_g1_i1.p1  ORF type:complete len:2212 (-),score=554.78 TRINITY_DN3286_c0_g1_i1:54-6689(-)
MAINEDWSLTQEKVFTRWCNVHLKERDLVLEKMVSGGFDTGVILWNLLQILSGKPIPSISLQPKMRIHMVNNLFTSFQFLEQEKIRLVGIGPEDILDHKQKLILGLVWTLILHYQISLNSGASEKGAKADLLKWLGSKGVPVNNFTTDWSDGLKLVQLVNALKPNTIENTFGSPEDLALRAINKAFDEFDIPKVLDPLDVATEHPDSLSVMTYISFFRQYDEEAKAISVDVDSISPPSPFIGNTLSFSLLGTITHPVLIVPTMDDNEKPVGTFHPGQSKDGGKVEYPLSAPGFHSFHVLYHGIDITNSPVKIEVKGGNEPTPAVVSVPPPAVSTPRENAPFVLKSSVNPSLAVVGNLFDFDISGEIENPSDLKATVEHDLGDDQAEFKPTASGGTVSFPLKTTGPHKFVVNYNGSPIKGSPVEVEVKAHPATLISVVETSVHHDQAVVGKDFSFRIAGPIEAPSSVQPQLIQPDGNIIDGLFSPETTGTGGRVTFPLTQPGKQTVDVKYGGLSVKNSPFVLNVIQAPATKIAVVAESVKPEEGEEGKDFVFSLSGPIPDPSLLVPELTTPSTKKVPGKFTPDPSNYGGTVAFPIEVIGDHVATVNYDGIPINGSPVSFEITPRAPQPVAPPAPVELPAELPEEAPQNPHKDDTKESIDDLLKGLSKPNLKSSHEPKPVPEDETDKNKGAAAIDSLLAELTPPQQPKRNSKPNANAIDDLLSGLESPAKPQKKDADNIDDLLSSLHTPPEKSKPKEESIDDLLSGLTPPPKKAPLKKGSEEIDDLLSSLSEKKKEEPKKEPEVAKPKKGSEEIDDLLSSLSVPQKKEEKKETAKPRGAEEIDDLLSSLNAPKKEEPKPKNDDDDLFSGLLPKQAPPKKKTVNPGAIDDLLSELQSPEPKKAPSKANQIDDLLSSLQAPVPAPAPKSSQPKKAVVLFGDASRTNFVVSKPITVQALTNHLSLEELDINVSHEGSGAYLPVDKLTTTINPNGVLDVTFSPSYLGVYVLEVEHKEGAFSPVTCKVNYNTPEHKATPMQLELLETLQTLGANISQNPDVALLKNDDQRASDNFPTVASLNTTLAYLSIAKSESSPQIEKSTRDLKKSTPEKAPAPVASNLSININVNHVEAPKAVIFPHSQFYSSSTSHKAPTSFEVSSLSLPPVGVVSQECVVANLGNISVDPHVITVVIVDEATGAEVGKGAIVKSADGTYNVIFSPTAQDKGHKVKAKLEVNGKPLLLTDADGREIVLPPIEIRLTPRILFFSSEVTLEGAQKKAENKSGLVGTPIVIGKVGVQGAPPKDVVFKLAKNGVVVNETIDLKVNPDGTFTIIANIAQPGDYTLNITYLGQPVIVENLPEIRVAEPQRKIELPPHQEDIHTTLQFVAPSLKTSSSNITAVTPPPVKKAQAKLSGQAAVFPVTSLPKVYRDRGDLEVRLTGAANVDGKLGLTDNDKIAIKFSPPSPGVYQATIHLPDGTPILSEPIEIEVGGKKAKIDSSKKASAPIESAKIPATNGVINYSDFVCKLSGPEKLTGQLVPLEGVPCISFVPRITGTYKCKIYHKGNSILDKPEIIIVSPQGITHQEIPDQLYSIGAGGLDLVLEAPQDARGLIIGYNELTDLKVTIQDARGAKHPTFGKVTKQGDDKLALRVCPTVPGIYSAQVFVFTHPVLTSPFRFQATEDTATRIKSEEPYVPDLRNVKDKDGNPLGLVYDKLRKMTCKLEAPNGDVLDGDIKLNWALDFTPTQAGPHKMQLYYKGKSILSPKITVLVEAGDPRPQELSGGPFNVNSAGFKLTIRSLTDSQNLEIPVHPSTDLHVEMIHKATGEKQLGSAFPEADDIAIEFKPPKSGTWEGQVYFKSKQKGGQLIPCLTQPLIMCATIDTNHSAPAPKPAPTPAPAAQEPSVQATTTFSDLINDLRAANQIAGTIQTINKSAKSLRTFDEFFNTLVNNAKKYSALYRTDWPTFSRFSEVERIDLVLVTSRGLLDNFSLIAENLGFFADLSVCTQMLSQMRDIYNNAARTLAVGRKLLSTPPAPLSEVANDYNSLAAEIQGTLTEVLKHVKRYKGRLEANTAPLFKFNLGRNSNEIVDALADWYNGECSLQLVEQSLGKKLPSDFKESIPIFMEILSNYLAQANAEEPHFGELLIRTGQMLAFIRCYAVETISDAVVNDLIAVINDMSQILIWFVGEKLRFNQAKASEYLTQIKDYARKVSAIFKQ